MPMLLVLEATIENGLITIDVRNTASHTIITSLELDETNVAATLEMPLERHQEYVVSWFIKAVGDDCIATLDIRKPKAAAVQVRKVVSPGATDFQAVVFRT